MDHHPTRFRDHRRQTTRLRFPTRRLKRLNSAGFYKLHGLPQLDDGTDRLRVVRHRPRSPGKHSDAQHPDAERIVPGPSRHSIEERPTESQRRGGSPAATVIISRVMLLVLSTHRILTTVCNFTRVSRRAGTLRRKRHFCSPTFQRKRFHDNSARSDYHDNQVL